MLDREKVIKGFECCDDTNLETLKCEECPYRETDTCSAIAKLHKDALEILKPVGGWISVKDRLPKNNSHVIVCDEDSKMVWPSHYMAATFYEESDSPYFTYHVNWWMPLPEPPKENNNGSR